MNGLALEISDRLFYLIVLSTVFIAAAGYVINDYFDIKTDLINHPETVVIDKIIKRRWAIILHVILTLLGLILGFIVSYKTGYLRLWLFHLLSASLLWFYSTHFKKQLLAGNIVVSILSASVVFIPFVFELGVMQHVFQNFNQVHKEAILSTFKITFIYALFAFITTFAREIIKDMEDFIGDKETGCNTLPIASGISVAKTTAFFLLMITSILLLIVVYNTFKNDRNIFNLNSLYVFFALVIPCAILATKILRDKASLNYKRSSLMLKCIMLLGLLYSLVFYYN